MTTDAGELMALAELRFFRDLVDVERMKVFKAFGVLSQEHDEFLTHGVQRQLFKQLCLFPSIAASQPDREAVARALARAQSETALTAYDAGAGLAVSYWNMQADAILSLLSVQVDGEQASLLEQSRIAPLANEDQIKHMVNRFLMWKLPESFSPDCGISFKKTFNDHRPQPMKNEPIGTNLFDAQQADAMVRYMLEGLPPVAETDADAPGGAKESDGGCQHPWAYQDHNGVPFCAACGEDWTNCMHPRPSDTTLSAEGMREALEPFAKIAEWYSDSEDDDFGPWVDVINVEDLRRLKLKDFRRARAALSALPVQSGKPSIATRPATSGTGAVDE